jgi:hypothetical protein
MYPTGTVFGPAVQIDPILPCDITFTLRYPDGRMVSTSGKGDAFGSWAGSRWTLDVPGIYRFNLEAEWQGHRGIMPGLPPEGGEIYVVERDKPPGAPELALNAPADLTFDANNGVHITGTSTAESVSYAAVIPGAVIDQGVLQVKGGKFDYFFEPKAINGRVATYDVANRNSGKTEIGDVVHLTFFSREKDSAGKPWHSFTRVIIRGNRVLAAR